MIRPTLVVAVVLLAVAGCGGSDTDSSSSVTPGGTTAPVTTTSPATTATQSGTPSPSVSEESTDAAAAGGFCEFLEEELPKLESAPSKVQALTILASDLAKWFETKNPGGQPDGSVIDEQTRESCPEVRTKVLKAIGMESFSQV